MVMSVVGVITEVVAKVEIDFVRGIARVAEKVGWAVSAVVVRVLTGVMAAVVRKAEWVTVVPAEVEIEILRVRAFGKVKWVVAKIAERVG